MEYLDYKDLYQDLKREKEIPGKRKADQGLHVIVCLLLEGGKKI